jgi:antitoxin component of RelBE/YafQ-DinJ toxin-antitoxin module
MHRKQSLEQELVEAVSEALNAQGAGNLVRPNAETIAAMKAARNGELVTVGKIDNLLRKLNEDD